jgi:SHS family lactate transporter-like MFS transporter
MEISGRFRRLTPPQQNAFMACFLGWSLDAFDYFILIFCLPALATHFQTQVSAITKAIFLTLAMRPVGAFLFGLMAERFGRRPTLMINVAVFTLFEVASAFAPTLGAFLVIRALFGIGMGGEWGVGAALAFETLPAEGRGFFSGVLQEGYVVGNLVAALAFGMLFGIVGWRGMFILGAVPAAVVLYLLSKVEESPAWLQGRVHRGTRPSPETDIQSHAGPFLFLVLLMFAFNSFSHGTQDLYPTFLQKNLELSARIVSIIAIVSSIGALLGGILFGTVSERMGRRRAIVIAAMLAIPMIPLWAYSRTVPWLAAGGFFMQFMVQGAWGVIPAHLNELSPPSVRGTLPGFAYQLGNLLSSGNAVIQARVAEIRYGGSFPPVLAWTVVIVATLVAIITTSGRERRGADLSNSA